MECFVTVGCWLDSHWGHYWMYYVGLSIVWVVKNSSSQMDWSIAEIFMPYCHPHPRARDSCYSVNGQFNQETYIFDGDLWFVNVRLIIVLIKKNNQIDFYCSYSMDCWEDRESPLSYPPQFDPAGIPSTPSVDKPGQLLLVQ